MKLLTFQVDRFAWRSHSQTLEEASPEAVEDEVGDALVAFVHIGQADEGEARARAFKKTLKHLKWAANKAALRTVVLHSFTHLGEVNADPAFAQAFLHEMDERLSGTGYTVKQTPFGWFCAWEISVRGDSMAKVFKSI